MAIDTQPTWAESTRWWTFVVTFTNCASLYLLGFSLIGLPIAAALREPLAAAIFGDAMMDVTTVLVFIMI